jgi:hypothetical protein
VATSTLKFRISPCRDKRYLNTFDCASSELMQYFPFGNEAAQWQFFGRISMTRKNKKMDNSRNGPSKTSPFIKMHRK